MLSGHRVVADQELFIEFFALAKPGHANWDVSLVWENLIGVVDEIGGARIRYCSPPMLTRQAFAATIRETPHDLLYLNSFFEPRFSIRPLLARRMGQLPKTPVLLAPRGEFSTGALSLKAARKRTYLKVGKAIGLFRGLHWHASTEHEAADIERTMGVRHESISIASDLAAPLVDRPPPLAARTTGAPLPSKQAA